MKITIFTALKYKAKRFTNAYKIAFALLLIVTIGLTAVLANPSDNEYNISVVHVFPGAVQAGNGWTNVSTLTEQNLDQFSLYQEFNDINSATFSLRKAVNTKDENLTFATATPEQILEDIDNQTDLQSPVNETEEDLIETTSVSTSTDDSQASSTPVITQDEIIEIETATSTEVPEVQFEVLPQTIEDTESVSSLPSSTETTINLDAVTSTESVKLPEVSETNNDESASTTAFEFVSGMFALLNETVTELLPFTSSSTKDEVVESEQPMEEEVVVPVDEQLEPISSSTTEIIDVVEEDVLSFAFATTTDTDAQEEVSGTTSVSEVVVETDVLPAEDITSEEALLSGEIDFSVTSTDLASTTDMIENDDCGNECADYRITLSDFGLPIFDDGTTLNGLQLKISFAAKMKETRDTAQWLKSLYSLDGGETWIAGGEIMVLDEVSNSTNGGYFVLPLPNITDPAILDVLQVQIVYEDDPRGLEGFFFESMWLELFTIAPPDILDSALNAIEDNGYDYQPLSGDRLFMPDGTLIRFTHTDDNTDETLIIKSDHVDYQGLSEVSAYVSVTNTSNKNDDFVLQTYFPQGIGQVDGVSAWNQNKPYEITVPEYRPFVYHCDAGWEAVDGEVPDTLEELSRKLMPEIIDHINEEEVEPVQFDPFNDVVEVMSTTSEQVAQEGEERDLENATTTSDSSEDILVEDEDVSEVTESDFDLETSIEPATSSSPEEVQELALPDEAPLLQAVIDEVLASSTASAETDSNAEESTGTVHYVCRNTNIVQTCDSLTADNTECRLESVKVREHNVVNYRGGWDQTQIGYGARADDRGFFKKVGDFFGFGPNKKEVPETFEVDSHSQERFTIRPGETRYFKVDISFPPFSSGEFWFEAIGQREYGLLDPFWSSQWQYRMPIQIDNTTGTEALTQQQIFFEIDSSLSDFWTNVAEDGGDIRFIQERSSNNIFPEDGPVFENNYDLNWQGRVAITIPSSQISENLTDFPVYIDLSTLGSDFWAGVQSDGRDIRVTRSDGSTEVPYDLVWIDGGTDTGELHFKAHRLSSTTDTTFHLYYDNPAATAYAATDPFGSENVWTNSYLAVYHFENEGQAGRDNVGEYTDSTSNSFDAEDDTDATGTTGYLGEGVEFDPSDDTTGADTFDHLNLPTTLLENREEYTMSTWYRTPTGGGADPTFVSGFNEACCGSDDELNIRVLNSVNMEQRTSNTWHRAGQVAIADIGDDVWRHFTYTYSDNNNGDFAGQFLNGAEVFTDTDVNAGTLNFDANGLIFGAEQDNNPDESGGLGESLDGFVDEVRFSSEARSDGWVEAEYETQANPTTFYSTSTNPITAAAGSDAWYSTSWNGRQLFTVPTSVVQDDQTDFPVYLDLAVLDPDIFSRVASDGRDIRITTKAGVELPIEIVNVDTSGQAGEVHFKTNLDSSENNEFYIYYDNPDAIAYADSDPFGAHNVWTNGFIGVYHFDEDASGTGNADVYTDSTSNEYHGDDENSSNDTTGRVGRGLELGDATGDHIDLPNDLLDGESDLTVEGWYQTSSGGVDRMLMSGANITTADEIMLWLDNDASGDDEFHIEVSNSDETFGLDDGSDWSDGGWDHFTAIMEDAPDEVNFYLNGEADAENPDTRVVDALSIDNGGLVIGQNQSSVGSFTTANQWIGQLDEFRFSNVIRSSSWIDTTYNNQADPTTFFSTSSAETLTEVEFVELDYWIQHFSSTTQEADIWVQVESVPAGETGIIWMYYGASGAVTTSDEWDTFTYDSMTELFYVVDSDVAQVTIQSLIDNNQVSFDGTGTTTLDRGEATTTTSVTGDTIIRALGPVSGTVNGTGNDGTDTIAPISFATTSFAVPTNRSPNEWFAFAPFGSTTVNIYEGSNTSPDATMQIATSTANTVAFDINPESNVGVDGLGMTADGNLPFILTHKHTVPGDGLVAYPPTTRDIFGIYTRDIHVSTVDATVNVEQTCSNGSSSTISGVTQGEQDADTTCAGASDPADQEGLGAAVRLYDQTGPIAAIQQADADGNESTVFWPEMEFSSRYAVTNDTEYIAAVCSPRFGETTIQVLSPTGDLVSSATCSPTATDPGKSLFINGNPDLTGTNDVNYTAGHQVVSTDGVPFYIIYDDVSTDTSGDEKNVIGAVQARKYGADSFTYAFGDQEIANDAEYDQISYRWYENNNLETPTDAWEIGGTDLDEAEAITGAGAVDDNNILRLRMNIQANTATGTVDSAAFRLEYGAAATDQCSTITNDSWFEVGQPGSTTAAFSGYNIAGIADGTELSSTTLASSTVFGSYEERNLSQLIRNEIGIGEVAEFDWIIEATNIEVNTNYCFRMTRSGGADFDSYTLYPQLETVGPPNIPTLITFFDNERTTTTAPILTFTSADIAGDDIDYEVQVATDVQFTSLVIGADSGTDFLAFENVNDGADKSPFTSGDTIRFNATNSIATSTTYWWRVRATDPNGSATTSDWSSPDSFTVEETLSASEWYQTTGDQFSTNALTNLATTSGEVTQSGSTAVMTGTEVDFDDATFGNAWGQVLWSSVETSATTSIQVQYYDGNEWALIPDSALPNNSVGATTSPLSISDLDTDTYNQIRLVATMDGTSVSFEEWSVQWGLRVNTPTLGDPFDNELINTLSPVFDFTTTDPQSDDLEYELELASDVAFTSVIGLYNSSTSPGFVDLTGGGSNPYPSGNQIQYTVQSPLTADNTYWWRVRAKDPDGGDSFSPWSTADSFTASTTPAVSTWYQTSQDQFNQGALDGTIASTSGSVEVSDFIGEYGTVNFTSNEWTTINTELNYQNMVVVASPEYDVMGDLDVARTPRVTNKTSNSFDLKVDDYNGFDTGSSTDVDYIVMEAGSWTLDDGASGLQLVAGTQENVTEVIVNNYGTLDNGQTVTFSPTFSSDPVALATLSTNNDPTWAGVHIDGGDRLTEVTGTTLRVAIAKSLSVLPHTSPENIDYLLVEDGTGTNDGTTFQTLTTTNAVVDSPNNGGYTQTLTGFSSEPAVTVVRNNAETGGNGGFALKDLSGTQSNTDLFLSIMEMNADTGGHGGTEAVSVFALEDSDGLLKRLDAGDLSGTITGEEVIFSNGTGPKFAAFDFIDTTPGSSDVLYQLEYEVSEGVYSLIPDVEIIGNSVGTTTGPIVLTDLDISTYGTIRPVATLSCVSGSCPTLDEWQVTWGEGVNMSGSVREYDRTTNVTSGSVAASVNGGASTTPVAIAGDGTWTIPNITAFDGDIVTVWVTSPATDADYAVAAFEYDGLGDITGVELFEQHLSLSSDENGTTTNVMLGLADNSYDPDIFFTVDGSNNLDLCPGGGGCTQNNIYVGPQDVYIPATTTPVTVSMHDFINDGFIELDANTFNVSGSYQNNATSSTDTAALNFVATSTSESITSSSSPLVFDTLTFGGGVGAATYTINDALDLSGDLTVASGTLARDDYDINVAGDITVEQAATFSGTGTTTFDGSGVRTWTDNSLLGINIGNVIIDGASTFVNIVGTTSAYDITIGANDTLSGGAGNVIQVGGDWTNNGTFLSGTSQVIIVPDDRTYPPLTPGSADWYADIGFLNRIPVNILASQVDGDLTNFPVYVDLGTLGADFWSNVKTDGGDIRVTESDGQTELPADVVEINSDAETGELHFLASSVSSSATTTFYIYFNNATATTPAADSTYGSEAVWTDYEAVYHFNELSFGLGSIVSDATANDRDMTVLGTALGTTTGQLGQAIDLDGTTGYLYDNDFSWSAGDRLTVSGWYYMDAADPGSDALWRWGDSNAGTDEDNPNEIRFRPWEEATTNTRGLFFFGRDDGTADYVINPRTGSVWRHYTTLGATSTSENNLVYEDASPVGSWAQTDANPSNLDGFLIGGDASGTGDSIDALTDELRISTQNRNSDWIEAEYTNQFTPSTFYATSSVNTYQPDTAVDEATHNISAGGSAFYALTFDDATTTPAFIDPSVVVDDNFTIATGTVTLPTGKLTVGGSFINNGFFMNNNSELEFTSSGAETITLGGTQFLNVLYDITFDGSGSWSFTDTDATTTNDFVIEDGTVTFPSGALSIGGTLTVSGGGFNANSGDIYFTSLENENVTTNGSSLNNVTFGQSGLSEGWYDNDWSHRTAIAVASTSLDAVVLNFPVYVDLSDLGSTFWSNVQSGGADIRVTTANGMTELPVEIVSIDTGAQTGELHFLSDNLQVLADTTFYIYHGNTAAEAVASDAVYGSEAVWQRYEAVYHFSDEPSVGALDATANGRDLVPQVLNAATTTGQVGQALDFDSIDGYLTAPGFTWTAGDALAISGWYYMNSSDSGDDSIWRWGTTGTFDNPNDMRFRPWETSNADRGLFFFGRDDGTADYVISPRVGSVWRHFVTLGATSTSDYNVVYEDGVGVGIWQQTDANPSSLDSFSVGLEQVGQYIDAAVDELRVGTTTLTEAFITAEYRNLSDTSTFYDGSVTQTFLSAVPAFTFNEATTDVDGDLNIISAALIAPTAELTIGGSALNTQGSYDPNSATTTFDSNDTGEAFDFGDVSFFNLAFDGVGGGWTVSTTTVTNNLTLQIGDSYVQSPNTTMSVGGIFQNNFANASTTWTDTTLVLTGGDYTVTDRLAEGDDYATLQVSNDTDIVIWNSSISTSTVSDVSSIYLPDHGGVNGELRIFGDYDRTSGAEYWSHATDFDGTDISGSPRQANVLIDNGARVFLSSGTTLNMIGDPLASTTVSSIFGAYSIELENATLNATEFTLSGAGSNGLELASSTAVTQFTNAFFTVETGRSAVTVDSSTMELQPSTQYTGIYFASTSLSTFYDADWSDQLLFTIPASSIPSTLTSFPVYIDLSTLGADFWSAVNSDGSDIRITQPDGTELPIDIVEVNSGAQTGEVHFLPSTLSSVEDNVFYIHFGNSAATRYDDAATYGANNVWSGYEAVYHFHEDPTTIGNVMTDMTGRGNDLTVLNAALATTTGQLGTAVDLDSSTGYLLANSFNWELGDYLALSGWYNMDAADDAPMFRWGTNANPNTIYFEPWETNNSSTRGNIQFGDSETYIISPRTASVWHQVVVNGPTTTGEVIELYEDTVQYEFATQGTANPSNDDGFRVGAAGTTGNFDGRVDELRIATSSFSTDWIDTEYTNHTNPASFYSTTSPTSVTEAFNVSVSGVPSTFWQFSGGAGNIYGEDYDNDDGDPGSIQWDNSNFSVSIGGVVYADDGVTPMGPPVCDGSTETITVVLDGTDTYQTTCDALTGAYEVNDIVFVGEPKITAYLESGASAPSTTPALYTQTNSNGIVAGNTATANVPSGLVDDTVLVAIVARDDNEGGTMSAPGGWTTIDILDTGTGDDREAGAWYRVVSDASSEPATYNFTVNDNDGEGYVTWMGGFVNADLSNPLDVANTWDNLSNDPSPAASSVTTATNNALVVAAWYTGTAETDATQPLDGWTGRADDLVNGDNTGVLQIATKPFASAGATGDVEATGVSGIRETMAIQIALRASSTPTLSGAESAAVVSQTPLGSPLSPYKDIELRDVQIGVGTVAASSNIVVDRPTVENGDLLLIVLGREEDGVGTVDPPAGWSTYALAAHTGGTDRYVGVWYKYVTNAASEPATYNFLNNNAAAREYSYWIAAVDNVDQTTPVDVTNSWTEYANSAAPTAPSVTTVTDKAYVLAAWYVMDDNNITMPVAPWETQTKNAQINNRSLNVVTQTFSSSGATGGVVPTDVGTGADTSAIQIPLRPETISVSDELTDFDFYQDRVIVRHEDIAALTIADMTRFDNADDSDVPFTASTSTSPDLLTVLGGSGLFVWANKTFSPDGEVDLQGGGNSAADGSFRIGNSATYNSSSTYDVTVGGSFYVNSAGTFNGASSTVTFTATNTGQQIGADASSTVNFYDLAFTGVDGGWAVQTPIVSATDILVSTGTISGVSDIDVDNGSFYGDGTVAMDAGQVHIKRNNTFGGTQPWSFSNMRLGDGVFSEVTTPAGTATTTVNGSLTIESGHFLDAEYSIWNFTGSGIVFNENGTFLEGTSTIRYSGDASITQTPYYNLRIETDGTAATATAPVTGLQVLNDLTVGETGTATLDITANDPLTSVGGSVYIAPLGTVLGSDSNTFQAFGNWDNDGVFISNDGLITFNSVPDATVAAGNSSFGEVQILGDGQHTFSESATATSHFIIGSSTGLVMASGTQLAVGGDFENRRGGVDTDWTDSTLYLYGGSIYDVSVKSIADSYATVTAASSTHARFWGSSFDNVNTIGSSSVYSRSHNGSSTDLYIFGNYINDTFNDYWSADLDFDGAAITPRQVGVYVEGGGSVTYTNGSLDVTGTSTASTTIQAQAAGTYGFAIENLASSSFQYYQFRDLDADGLTFAGSAIVDELSSGDFLVEQNGDTAITVEGTVIDVNPAKNFTEVFFASSTGVSAFNVTATGTPSSGWRFALATSTLYGEDFDVDPGGNPGYILWDDSDPIYDIDGFVYQAGTTNPSTACDGVTPNIRVAFEGVLNTASSTCDAGDGSFSIQNISPPGLSDTITVFINSNGSEQGVTISEDLFATIGDMVIYEDTVTVRHESGDSLSIADAGTYDSGDDTDIPFTVVGSTMTLDPDIKLLVWNSKTFEPQGNLVTGGGAADNFDGTVELQANATLEFSSGEDHSIGGNLEMDSTATFVPDTATTTFTSAGTGRTIDTNEAGFYDLVLSGSGEFTFQDTALEVANDFSNTNASSTFPAATTTVGGSFTVTSGTFNANGGVVAFSSASSGNTIDPGGSDFTNVSFTGSGDWSITAVNATVTDTIRFDAGSVTLPSGTLAVGGDFLDGSGLFVNNSGTVQLTTSSVSDLQIGGSTLGSVRQTGVGTVTMTELNGALAGDLVLDAGAMILASGTLSVGGSLDATGGVFDNASGTVLFNSTGGSETIDPGSSAFYNVSFGSGSGDWTITANATATNNFAITTASSFTLNPNLTLFVGGVFTNSVGGAATTWTDSVLWLGSGTDYSINTKSVSGDTYGTLYIDEDMQIRSWNSTAATTTLSSTTISSLYSQDHAGTDGDLYVYGSLQVATGTEYWSYATDFDGAALIGGARRAVDVYVVSAASSSIAVSDTAVLQIIGDPTATSTIQAVGADQYSFDFTDATLNASYYALRDLDINGLTFNGATNITSLDYGDFEQALNSASLITLASTTLNANASLTVTGNRFASGGFTGGVNINLDATTTNSWIYTAHYGGLDGEDYDIDGSDACSSIRWDDSECLLTEQTHYRWRNDDGGEGALDSEWFDTDWDARKRVRVINADASAYTDTVVRVPVTYDADMQTNFDDLRFTDSSGTTTVPYWIERSTIGVSADVWVQVPILPANDVAVLYMYYDNVTASSTSSSTETFSAVDDFEDGGISEYGGTDASLFEVSGSFAFGGTNGLDASSGNESQRATNGGIATNDQTVSQGDIIRYRQYVTTGTSDEACVKFATQTNINENYGVCLEQAFGSPRLALVEDVVYNDSGAGVISLDSDTLTFSDQWYEVEIDWQTDGDIDVTLFDASGTEVATTSANDTTYTTGGFGFTFWGQNGGWDSFVAYPRTDTRPAVQIGVEQGRGGATWAAAQDTVGSGFAFNEVARLRVSIENTGLDIENQNFRLEFAPKLTAPSCEAVSSGDFNQVPISSSCGSSALCMIASASTTDGEATTDHLLTDAGSFVVGEIVTDTSNETGNIDVDQDQYTELEYAVELTSNAVNDAYCFRVTNAGTELDSYALLPELNLQFDPDLTNVTLNDGMGIMLDAGATTTIYATGTVTDLNGVADLNTATATFYRSGVGAACSADVNNCYIEAGSPSCTFIDCGATSCTLSCQADFVYHADPTDIGSYAGEEWFAFLEVEDQSGAMDFDTSIGQELMTLRALDVDNDIAYGAVDINSDTGAFNPDTIVKNYGNEAIDVDVSGTDMTDGGVSVIPPTEQLFSTTTFTYSACTGCSTLSALGTNIEIDLDKPTTTSPYLEDSLYWGIAIPFGTAGAPHQGTNTFTAVAD